MVLIGPQGRRNHPLPVLLKEVTLSRERLNWNPSLVFMPMELQYVQPRCPHPPLRAMTGEEGIKRVVTLGDGSTYGQIYLKAIDLLD